MSDLPQAISESTITIGDMVLRCYVLDDGRRMIQADDFELFMARFLGGWELSEAELESLGEFTRSG